jgi:dolichol-phosphate mannosyltransferase
MNSSIVVIPTYNEVESIGVLLDALKLLSLDILVIDDGSPDGTAELCRARGVEVISRSGKMGLGGAYRCGFAVALERGYAYVMEMAAEGCHLVSDLARLMEWIGTSELLIGSRWVADGAIENWSRFREYLSKAANTYANAVLSLGIKDTTSGLRIYNADLLKRMDISTIKSEGYCFQIEMTRRAIARGGSIGEIPITFIERAHGVSKMSFAIALEAIFRITSWGLLRLIGR